MALYALRRLDDVGGQDVAASGAGTGGALIVQWAKLFGARRVCAFDKILFT